MQTAKQKRNKKRCFWVGATVVISLCLSVACSATPQEKTSTTFVMDTLVTQTAYGEHAETAMQEVNRVLSEEEARLSLFLQESEIAKVNAGAGGAAVAVSPKTAQLVSEVLALSTQSEGAFAISIAPLTTAWNTTGDAPRVVLEDETDELLSLVDDTAVHVQNDTIALEMQGMGLDLGGVAKGAACSAAADVYEEYGVSSALLYLGGNIYAHGTKPDSSAWCIGFRDPEGGQNSYIASFPLQDEVVAISGGYERYFEEDGERYIHILDPRTGRPAESDLLAVGVIDKDGLKADFWSTTLFVQGLSGALRFMEDGGRAIALDKEGNLYISAALEEGFALQNPESHTLHVVEAIS